MIDWNSIRSMTLQDIFLQAKEYPHNNSEFFNFDHDSKNEHVRNSVTTYYSIAKMAYEEKLAMNEIFGYNLASDPVMIMLLDLFLAEERKKKISTTSLCLATLAPATTALRWISVLADRDYVNRSGSSTDRRLVFVSLSDKGREAVIKYLDRLSEKWHIAVDRQLSLNGLEI